jgi:hypothetical protein
MVADVADGADGMCLAHVDDIPRQDSAERAFNKLTRTFAMQMEALNRYRSGAERRSHCNMFQ